MYRGFTEGFATADPRHGERAPEVVAVTEVVGPLTPYAATAHVGMSSLEGHPGNTRKRALPARPPLPRAFPGYVRAFGISTGLGNARCYLVRQLGTVSG